MGKSSAKHLYRGVQTCDNALMHRGRRGPGGSGIARAEQDRGEEQAWVRRSHLPPSGRRFRRIGRPCGSRHRLRGARRHMLGLFRYVRAAHDERLRRSRRLDHLRAPAAGSRHLPRRVRRARAAQPGGGAARQALARPHRSLLAAGRAADAGQLPVGHLLHERGHRHGSRAPRPRGHHGLSCACACGAGRASEGFGLVLALAAPSSSPRRATSARSPYRPRAIWGVVSAFALAFYTLLPGKVLAKWGSFIVTGLAMLLGGMVATAVVQPWTIPVDIRRRSSASSAPW